MTAPPPTVSVHTPTSSFALIHSLNEESIMQLFNKLSRKRSEFNGKRVGAGWVKYYWNDSVWSLDDDSDYTIFVWRQKSPSTSSTESPPITLHVHDPTAPLPQPPSYRNASYYLFQPSRVTSPPPRSARSTKSQRTTKTKSKAASVNDDALSGIAKHRKEFERFHSENGVRTVMGSIGPVDNVRMLLKNGYRHVYISRRFALKNGFIPADAVPGYYGYGGLVNLGKWPVTLNIASDLEETIQQANGNAQPKARKSKTVSVPIYLSEEPHFDVVLGRSFFERRQIKISATDPTEVLCLDTGEKIECELVVLKDGKGDIVIVS